MLGPCVMDESPEYPEGWPSNLMGKARLWLKTGIPETGIQRSRAALQFWSAKLKDRLANQVHQIRSAALRIGQDFFAHARIPKALEMVGHSFHRQGVVGFGLEEITDVVRHVNQALDVHAFQFSRVVNRWASSAYTTKRLLRVKPASVRPAYRAMRTASPVGAETAANRPMPAMAAFCTIS